MAKNISEAKKKEIEKYLLSNQNKDTVYVAGRFQVSEGTVRRIKRRMGNTLPPQTVENDQEERKAKKVRRDVDKNYKEALIQIEYMEKELDAYRTCKGLLSSASPMSITVPAASTNSKAVPVLIASDWHIDEVIEGASIGNVNNFNLDIARDRVHRFFRYSAKLIDMLKKESDIDTLLIAALGDFMSSWLHDELIQSNSLTPPEAILELFEMWVGGLDFLLNTELVKDVVFVGAVGNHGRITQKTQFKGRHKKSYEWILYSLLAKHYNAIGEKRINFQLPNGYFNWVKLFGKDIRLHHGDNLRYHGGVGGVHIPVRKAIAQWNKVRHADLDVFGHWHTLEWSESYVINNSLIGYSEYAENLKTDFMKAGQALFLMHSKYGKTAQFPIVLQD